jgi:hypothetical protein
VSIQKAMGIEREVNDVRNVRYQKLEGKPINPKAYMEDEYDGSWAAFCGKKKKKDEGEAEETEVQAGDLVEALEKELAQRLTGQQSAIRNWAKIGLRVQIVQAFNMLD